MMTLLNAFPCIGAYGYLARRLRRKLSHILYKRIPAALLGWWVELLVSADTHSFCHINILLFKCCQPLVANYTPFVSVPVQFLMSGVSDPALLKDDLMWSLKRFF